jgi:hypothetical protein
MAASSLPLAADVEDWLDALGVVRKRRGGLAVTSGGQDGQCEYPVTRTAGTIGSWRTVHCFGNEHPVGSVGFAQQSVQRSVNERSAREYLGVRCARK